MQHPNLVHLIGVCLDNLSVCFITEYMAMVSKPSTPKMRAHPASIIIVGSSSILALNVLNKYLSIQFSSILVDKVLHTHIVQSSLCMHADSK